MCGIFGTTRPLADKHIDKITELLNHRGPDSSGYTRLERVGNNTPITLLHTRLAIQDLSPNGRQPMQSKCSRWWVTFNGEIYNHFELRKALNCEFNGSSDTETLVEYIAAFGIDKTVADLNGMFGFCAFDSQEQMLYLVRDNFGIKPVYYAYDDQHLTFSSELKPIISAENRSQAINHQALDLFLSLRYTPSTDTLINGIKRLPPGHVLKFDLKTKKAVTHRFIETTVNKYRGSVDDAITDYQDLLSRAVRRQLLSDVPVGVLLSGGIDSAIIAAFARENTKDISSYTVGFGSEHYECEIDDAAETARILDIPHHSVTVTPQGLLDSLATIVQSVEEPLGTTSIMPMWYLSEKAKQDVTVVLTGQGNDEPWGGYLRYQIELLLAQFPLFKAPFFRVPDLINRQVRKESLRRGLRCLGEGDTLQRFIQAYAFFSDREKQLLIPGNRDLSTRNAIQYWMDWLADADIADAEKMMRLDTRMNLADDLLLYADKISMAFALETRVPMLDKDLVAFIESLPLEYRTSINKTKVVHRAMARNYLPDKIVNRPKKAFQVPFGEWSKTIWLDYISANLLNRNLKIYNHLDFNGVNQLWQAHLKSKPDYSKQIFALLTFAIWGEEFL